MNLINKIQHINTLQSQAIQYNKMEEESPSFIVYFLTLLGGCIANITFLFFLFLVTEFKNNIVLLLVAFALLGLTFLVNQKTNSKIIQTFLTTTFLTGISCFLSYLILESLTAETIYVILIIINLLALYYLLSPIIKLISAIGVLTALTLLVVSFFGTTAFNYLNLIALIALVLVYKKEVLWFGNATWQKFYTPVLLAIQLYLLLIYQLQKITSSFHIYDITQTGLFTKNIIPIALLLILYVTFLKGTDLKHYKHPIQFALYLLTALLFGILIYYEPYLLYGLLYIILAYKFKDDMFFITSCLYFILFLGFMYYDLQTTLLNKSLLLMGSGLVFLLQYVLIKLLRKNEKN
ncbi:DUF4401 domain-containing protein [Flavobacterium agricola]|uniref:DUF4401 domain-containing protein n=1 Tax=Flavobacterium agricola TaxID=2870839 RepID=A0ABY6LZ95_9FLAO|nr:DUF4401 domain-containing protein [Flavobacterium agricola]UYW00729.1 DUF4401 domain-containing protein [Flavobacterium agricola]